MVTKKVFHLILILWFRGWFFFFFLFFSFFLLKSSIFVIEIDLFSDFFYDLSLSFVLDFYSILFASVVRIISSIIFFFAQYYIDSDKQQKGFILLLRFFVFAMFFLIFSPNLFFLLLGWDGLGLVSYLLVVYYIRVSRSIAGMLTFIINRVGDIFFLFSISLLSLIGFYSFYDLKRIVFIQIGALCILFTFITKRAQIPFSSWLPAAIAAPTPVSSLVHSSTLVTAGVFLLIRFRYVLIFMFYFLIILALITLIIAGIMANLEWDIKKIIAYSTLRQLSFIMLSFSSGLILFCFFHLLTHALFKASLFIRAGVVIHSEDSSQDFRNISPFSNGKKLFASSFVVCILSLCGFPFFSGFFSKDLILDGTYFTFLFVFLFLVGVLLTISYSVRFIIYILISISTFRASLGAVYENVKYLLFPVWLIILLAIIMGFLWVEYFFNFFFFFSCLLILWKMLYLFICVICVFLIYKIVFFNYFFFNIYFFRFIWFLNQNFTARGLKIFKKISDKIFRFLDNSWLETIGPQKIYFIFIGVGFNLINFINVNLVYFFILFVFSVIITICKNSLY